MPVLAAADGTILAGQLATKAKASEFKSSQAAVSHIATQGLLLEEHGYPVSKLRWSPI